MITSFFLFDEYDLVSTCIGVVLLGQFFTGERELHLWKS